MIDVEFQIAGDENIKSPISIVIAETRSCAPAFPRAAKFRPDIGESTVAVVVIETGEAEVAHIYVRAPVVIVVANSHSHAPPLVCHARFFSNVLELPVSQIAIERGARRLLLALHRSDGRSIEEKDVRAAITVIVKDRHSAGRSLDYVILLRASGVMFEPCERSPRSQVFKDHWSLWFRDSDRSPRSVCAGRSG